MVSPRIVSEGDYYKAQVSSYTKYDLPMCIHVYTQDCYKQLYGAGMKGYVRKAPHYYDYYHQKFWIVDNTTIHLSTGVLSVCMRASVHMFVCMCMHVCIIIVQICSLLLASS